MAPHSGVRVWRVSFQGVIRLPPTPQQECWCRRDPQPSMNDSPWLGVPRHRGGPALAACPAWGCLLSTPWTPAAESPVDSLCRAAEEPDPWAKAESWGSCGIDPNTLSFTERSLCTGPCTQHAIVSPKQPHEAGIIVSILQMSKLRLWEVT